MQNFTNEDISRRLNGVEHLRSLYQSLTELGANPYHGHVDSYVAMYKQPTPLGYWKAIGVDEVGDIVLNFGYTVLQTDEEFLEVVNNRLEGLLDE